MAYLQLYLYLAYLQLYLYQDLENKFINKQLKCLDIFSDTFIIAYNSNHLSVGCGYVLSHSGLRGKYNFQVLIWPQKTSKIYIFSILICEIF